MKGGATFALLQDLHNVTSLNQVVDLLLAAGIATILPFDRFEQQLRECICRMPTKSTVLEKILEKVKVQYQDQQTAYKLVEISP